jgi:O-antigen ligase
MEMRFFSESTTSFWSIIVERLDWQHIIMDPRVAYFLVLWEVVSENPILGVGAGNFGVLGSAMLGANVLISAHGVPWAALAEFGLLGFAALMVAFGTVMISLGKSIRRCKIQSQRVVMIGLFASLTALLINTCTGADRPPFHLIFLLGIAATYSFFSRRLTETDGV